MDNKTIGRMIVTTKITEYILAKITEYILDEVLENHPEIVYRAIVKLFEKEG